MSNMMRLLDMCFEAVPVLKQLFAVVDDTPEHPRGLRVVFRHMKIETLVFFEAPATQKACVNSGGVRILLVLDQLPDNPGRVGAAREVAGVRQQRYRRYGFLRVAPHHVQI